MSECDRKTKEECDDDYDCTWDRKDSYCREFTDGEKKTGAILSWLFIVIAIIIVILIVYYLIKSSDDDSSDTSLVRTVGDMQKIDENLSVLDMLSD